MRRFLGLALFALAPMMTARAAPPPNADWARIVGELIQKIECAPAQVKTPATNPGHASLPEPSAAPCLRETGLAVTIVRDGKTLLAQGYGLRERAKKLPVTSQTLFALGSTTKAFTSAALMMAVEDGKLDIEAPVRQYMPDFALQDEAVSAQVTAVDLMSHRTGLPRHDMLWYVTPFSSDELYTKLRYLDLNPKPDFQFRKGWQYSNLSFLTAGRLLEKVSGQSWADFVRSRILRPLHMDHTLLLTSELAAQERAQGYARERPLPLHRVDQVAPAGAMLSNADDMAAWLRFHVAHGLSPEGQSLLREDSLALLYRPRIQVPSDASRHFDYGLGWMIQSLPTGRIIFHGGNIDGFTSIVALVPRLNLGVAVLSNQNGSHLPNSLLNELVQLFDAPAPQALLAMPRENEKTERPFPDAELCRRWTSPARASRETTSLVPPREPIDVSSGPTVVGRFTHPAYGEIVVSSEGGDARLRYYDAEGPLEHAIDLSLRWPLYFFGERAGEIPVTYASDLQSLSLPLALDDGIPPVTFKRLE